MDFTLDNEQKALRVAVRDMVSRRTPADEIGDASHDAELWKALAEIGALALPFEDGVGPVEVMIVAEELGRGRARSAYTETVLAGHVLADCGHELVEAIGEGTAVVVPALAEPGRAWSLESTVTATEAGGGWALSGVKEPVAYGDAATHVVVNADRGVFLVEAPQVSGSRLVLDNIAATLLTEDPAILQAAVNRATAALCAEALGAMESALTLTVEYLKTRKQFGVPLASFQTLTQRAADLYVHLELARSVVQFAAMALAENPGDTDLVSRTKVIVGKSGRLIGQEAIQLHGGIGVTAEYAVGHLTARLTAIEHSYGDTRTHLGRLAAGVSGYDSVAVI